MGSINSYADELMIDFADAANREIARVLAEEFGHDWLTQGVRKHFKPEQFERVEQMLQNPMRVVEMEKGPEDVHGLEHFWQIINGNWGLFATRFQDKQRTQVFLSEIKEMRDNLAHRRKRHVLLRSDLVRIVGNCRMVLSAFESRSADKFAEVVDSLSSGGAPWGAALEGHLPPSDEIYDEFVGRPGELNELSDWLASDSRQILVWGYGGAGKSALAHKFARDIRDGSSESLIAACWVSAKRKEYVEGEERDRPADFRNMDELVRAVWSALYGADEVPQDLDSPSVLKHLREMPTLLVVDDFDTVLDDEELSAFLLYELRNTPTRVIYTSRHRVPGVKNLEVPPFGDSDLKEFVRVRSVEYGANQQQCLARVDGIKRVTDGYPLFVDDLIRHAAIIGVDSAMEDWSQKRGDAAREYALRRQITHLGQSCGDVLIALSAANRPLLPVEVSNIAGLTDPDAEAGLRVLRDWKMVNQVTEDDSSSPAYRMTANTIRLVQQTFRDDNRLRTAKTAFNALTGERVPEMKRRAIGQIIARVTQLEFTEGFESAEEHLNDSMTGELTDSPDLYGVLGWLYSKQPADQYGESARQAFDRSYRLGSSKVDTFYHWLTMEKNIAEAMITQAQEGSISNDTVAEQWKEVERVAEIGIDRCGASQVLCYWAGYAAAREAKSRDRARQFAYAQGAYDRSLYRFNQALGAPVSDVSGVNKGQIYRGLTLACEGLGDEDQLRRTLAQWHSFSGSDWYFETEFRRLLQTYPTLQSDPRFRDMFQGRVF